MEEQKRHGRPPIFGVAMTQAERQRRHRAFHRAKVERLEMRKTAFDQVMEFHNVFGHPVAADPASAPAQRQRLRLMLILEEAAEVIDAVRGYNSVTDTPHLTSAHDAVVGAISAIRSAADPEFSECDLVNLAKELADLEYVTCGAALENGIDLDAVMGEVHRSNMSKLDPATGRPIYNADGKVIKGAAYSVADIDGVLFPGLDEELQMELLAEEEESQA